MANETHIKIAPSAEENLHEMMDMIGAIESRTKELGAVPGEVDALKNKLAELHSRCDELDKRLPRGSKVYAAETPTKNEALGEFGRVLSAAWRFKQYGKLDPEYQRAGGAAGNFGDGSAAQGGVLVPVITYDKIARIIGEASIIRKIATVVPMTTNTMTMPTKTAGPQVFWLASEATSGGDSIKTSVALGNPQLISKTMMALDEISAELDEDSIVALEPFFATIFAEAVAQEENQKAFSSTSTFSGIVGTTAIDSTRKTFASGSAFSSVTYTDLLNLQYSIDSKCVHKGTWVMSPQAFKSVMNIKDSNGRPIFHTGWVSLPAPSPTPDQGTAAPTMVMGRPCYLTDTLPSSPENSQVFAIYGDFSKYAFGDRKQMSIDWSDQVYFEYGNLALRVRERIALKPLITSAFNYTRSNA